MARYLFPGDVGFLPDGGLAASQVFTMWDDLVAGAQITDWTELDGATPATLATDGNGLRPHLRGPDGFIGPAYFDIGADIRYRVDADEPLTAAIEGAENALRTYRVNSQTGTSYTLVGDDAGALVTFNNVSAVIVTVPTDAAGGYQIGTHVDLLQLGVGQVTVVGDSGVTVEGTPGPILADQYSAASLVNVAANSWVIVGRLTA